MSADEQPVTATADNATAETSSAVEDAMRSEKILKAKELFSRGSRNYLLKNYPESADELSMVCELYQELYGELSDELGMPYLLYAKSLIALALDENKIIDVPDEEDEDEDDEEDEDGLGTEEALMANSPVVGGTSNSLSTNGEALNNVVDEVKAEASTSASKCPEEDEADSTADAEKEKMKTAADTASDGAGHSGSLKSTDEAMVTSTEDGVTAASVASKSKNGSMSNLTKMEKPTTSNGGGGGGAVTAGGDADEDDEENEAASTLQLAWEILELAAKIFARQGLNGLPNLAEVQTELGNIEFENNILDSARDDYEKALKIYADLPANYRRAKAEIHYKIGLTYLMQQLNKEGAASLKEACNLIEDEIAELRAKEDHTEKEKNTIQDMEETKEEILVKINEIEEAQAQNIAEVRAALDKVISKPGGLESIGDGAKPSSSVDIITGASSSSSSSTAGAAISSSTKPTDISHLIKRKKPEPGSEAEAVEESPAKRPAV